jgi:hypothetical protein
MLSVAVMNVVILSFIMLSVEADIQNNSHSCCGQLCIITTKNTVLICDFIIQCAKASPVLSLAVIVAKHKLNILLMLKG